MVSFQRTVKGVAYMPALLRIDSEDVFCFCNRHSSLHSPHSFRHISADNIQCEALGFEVCVVRPEDLLEMWRFLNQSVFDCLPFFGSGHSLLDDAGLLTDLLEVIS